MAITIQDNGKDNQISIEEHTNAISSGVIIINGNNNIVKIGKNSTLTNLLIESIGNNASISIGDNCVLLGEHRCRTHDTIISIGDFTTMMGVRIFLHEKVSISIGNDCMFSSGVLMDVSDKHSIIDLKKNKRINFPKNIKIADHVWIGFDVYIVKGINIGANSIVGAKSLVTKDIAENSMAVGVPAKIIKTGFTWDRQCLPN